MNKKIYKRVGLLSISALAALSLAVPVKAEQSCKRYANYYFFSETNTEAYYKEKFSQSDSKKFEFVTSIKSPKLPEGFSNLEEGKVCLTNGNYDESTSNVECIKNEKWDLKTFYEKTKLISKGTTENYTVDGKTVKYTHYDEEVNGEIRRYLNHNTWYLKEGTKFTERTDGNDYFEITVDTLINGSIFPQTTTIGRDFGNKEYDTYTVTRTHTESELTGVTPFLYKWAGENEPSNTLIAPNLYKVAYDVCEDKFKAEIDYINKDTNEKVHEPYKKDDLSNGDKDSVDSPKVDGCTLVDKNDSTVDYTIDNTDYQKTVYYTCKAESPAVNPKTGNALIFVAWVVGLGSLGYSIYWFKKNKKEEV